MKRKFCAEIRKYDGLWLMQEQIEAKLAVMKTDSIQFRQKLVSICPSDYKKTFFLSEKSHVRFVIELTEILKALLGKLKNDKTVTRPSEEQNFSDVKSQNKLFEEKDLKERLQTLSQKEVEKLVKRKQPTCAKKKKTNRDSELNVPIDTSVEEQ